LQSNEGFIELNIFIFEKNIKSTDVIIKYFIFFLSKIFFVFNEESYIDLNNLVVVVEMKLLFFLYILNNN